jgi:hypothetical protein
MIGAIIWPLVALAIAALATYAFTRWLARDTTTVRELRAELKATQEDWGKRFEKYERAHDMLVTRFNNTSPSPNPLGKTYSTRS